MDTITHPATCNAHWANGPTPACDEHARGIVALGRFMGMHVPLTKLDQPANCANCVNEAKSAGGPR